MVFSYLFGVSRRWEMMVLLSSGIAINYTLRLNMSVAAPDMKEELEWDESSRGFVLSSFYWGYAFGQVPFSKLAQYYGAKVLFAMSVLIPSFLSLLVPMVAHSSLGGLLCLRVLIGFFSAALFPSAYHFFPIWVPADEKTVLIPLVVSGSFIGEIIGFLVSGYLLQCTIGLPGGDVEGWPLLFLFFGLVGLAWVPLWVICAYESPSVHPYMSEDELVYIMDGTYTTTASLSYKPLLDATGSDYDYNLDKDSRGDDKYHTVENPMIPNDEDGLIDIPPPPNSGASALPITRRIVKDKDSSTNNSNNSVSTSMVPPSPTGNTLRRHLFSVTPEKDSTHKPHAHTDTNLISHITTRASLTSSNSHSPSRNLTYTRSRASLDGIQSHTHFTSSPLGQPTGREYSVSVTSEERIDAVLCSSSRQNSTSSEKNSMNTPWRAFLTTPASLTLLLGCWTTGWTGFLLLSELPSYLTDRLGFDSSNAGLFCIAPYFALLLSTYGFGEFFRHLQMNHNWATRTVRQTAQLISFLGSGICLFICAFVNSKGTGLTMMILAQIWLGANNSGLACAFLDLAPRFSGNYNSLGNMLAAVAGIMGPMVVSALLGAYGNSKGWTAVFLLTTLVSVFASAMWVLFQSSVVDDRLNKPQAAKR